MGWWLERFLRKHMNGLRVAAWGMPSVPEGGSFVVYSNHPSWWDAVVYMVLARRLFPDVACHAPMEAAMLERYRVFERIGAFPVEPQSVRGALAFLATCREILASPGRAVWVTAQGRFADVRQRPLRLRPGVSRLVEATRATHVVPLAIEYAFWTERGAEVLVAFGPPMGAGDLAALDRPDREARLEETLATLMDRLAAEACGRDPGRFVSLLEGRPGIGGLYDLWRRGVALASGKHFDPAHRVRAE